MRDPRFILPASRAVPLVVILLALLLTACQPAPSTDTALPSPTVLFSTSTPLPLNIRPTQTPRAIGTARPADTPTPRPTPTRWPIELLLSPGDHPPIGTLEPLLLTQIAARAASSSALPVDLESLLATGEGVIGWSVEGRPLAARALGSGDRTILLVGGMHGGWEANSVQLVEALIAHFEAHPGDIQPGIRLVLIPVLNPDGLLHGRTPEGRFNANGVDLNRNWPCDWSDSAQWREMAVNPGPQPLSEPETQALATFVRQLRPAVALFYHSAANGIYAGECSGDHGSAAMAAVLGEATGYHYGSDFNAYPVTGAASNWADGEGIPAADVELITWTDPEFDRNLRGILALQSWLTESR